MDAALWSSISALLGATVGGGISYLLNRQVLRNQLRVLQEQHKVEYMAEETARHFLSHKSYTDRSFETLPSSRSPRPQRSTWKRVSTGISASRVLRHSSCAITCVPLRPVPPTKTIGAVSGRPSIGFLCMSVRG